LVRFEALLATEGLTVEFTEPAVDVMADLAFQVNQSTQNIGARRLHTILERVLEEISFDAPDRVDKKVVIDEGLVRQRLDELTKGKDLSRCIL
jgi:ATP-dependent HslUV protease ATP-binding subunit HslU